MAPVELPPKDIELILAGIDDNVEEAVIYAFEDVKPIIQQAHEKGVKYGVRDLKKAGFIVDIPPDPNDLEFLDGYNFDLIKGLGEDLKKELRRVIRDGIMHGKGIPQIAKELREALKRKEARINTIARTETMRASNYGRIRTWEKSGVKYKEWLTAFDDRTCPICADLDGERRRLEDLFSVGVYMPPAHPNCRCTAVPIIKTQETESESRHFETLEIENDERRRRESIYNRTLEMQYSKALKRHFKDAIAKIIQMLEIQMGGK